MQEKQASKKSDVWAIGVILYQLLHKDGKTPFKKGSEYLTFQAILERELDLSIIRDCAMDVKDSIDEWIDLIDKILVIESYKRLGMSEVKSHGVFKKVDWNHEIWNEASPLPIIKKESDVSLDDEKEVEFFNQLVVSNSTQNIPSFSAPVLSDVQDLKETPRTSDVCNSNVEMNLESRLIAEEERRGILEIQSKSSPFSEKLLPNELILFSKCFKRVIYLHLLFRGTSMVYGKHELD